MPAFVPDKRGIAQWYVLMHTPVAPCRPEHTGVLARHHPEAKAKPKAAKDTQHANETKKPKPRSTRAQKHAEKAAALDAARRAPKKPVK